MTKECFRDPKNKRCKQDDYKPKTQSQDRRPKKKPKFNKTNVAEQEEESAMLFTISDPQNDTQKTPVDEGVLVN